MEARIGSPYYAPCFRRTSRGTHRVIVGLFVAYIASRCHIGKRVKWRTGHLRAIAHFVHTHIFTHHFEDPNSRLPSVVWRTYFPRTSNICVPLPCFPRLPVLCQSVTQYLTPMGAPRPKQAHTHTVPRHRVTHAYMRAYSSVWAIFSTLRWLSQEKPTQ